jgi:lipid-A-disaccharide synthase
MPTVAVVAGETSGDIHAGNLVAALRRARPDATVWAVGGDRLAAAGAEIVFPSQRISAMGLTEVLCKLPELARVRSLVVERFYQNPPDLFVPVDFGGLNLKLAKVAKRLKIPVVYFIPPKAWAWGAWRVPKIRAAVDELLVILPFEETFWRGHGVTCTYVGSPLLDHLTTRRFTPEADLVGLLPGSRMGEIRKIWPQLVAAARLLSQGRRLRFMAPLAQGLPKGCLDVAEASGLDLTIVDGNAQEVMERARVCLVASGTATLECALVGTPMVAVYRVSGLTYAVGRRLVRLPYVTLPNLIAEDGVVPEIIQGSPAEIARAAAPLLDDGPERSRMLEGLHKVQNIIGQRGASERAAARLSEYF